MGVVAFRLIICAQGRYRNDLHTSKESNSSDCTGELGKLPTCPEIEASRDPTSVLFFTFIRDHLIQDSKQTQGSTGRCKMTDTLFFNLPKTTSV